MFLPRRSSQKEPPPAAAAAAAAADVAAATMLSPSSPPNPITIPNPLLQSPNAIPPRTSSTGQFNVPHQPSKSALRPVPEANWLSQSVSTATGPLSSATITTGTTSTTSTTAATAPAAPSATTAGRRLSAHRPSPTSTSFLATMQPPSPPADPQRYATEDLDFAAKKTWSEDKEKAVAAPFDYLDAHPGKDFRPQLIHAFDAWLEVPPASLEIITKVVGMLHTASLLIDDVEDSSDLRRGWPVAHNLFGVPQTINSANYVYFCALQELQRLRNPRTIAVYAEELLNLHRGQGMDLFWRDTLTCPTEDDYLEMVGNKTGGLFRLGIKLMQAESAAPLDCVPLVNIVGLIFQIRDDYLNLHATEYRANKGLCEDLTEGKFSFPVIHSIRSDPTNFQLLNILKQRTADEAVKRYAVEYMKGTGSFEYTKRVVEVLVARARRMTDELDGGRGRSAGIHKILDKMTL